MVGQSGIWLFELMLERVTVWLNINVRGFYSYVRCPRFYSTDKVLTQDWKLWVVLLRF